jgi:hypothetical protein
MLIRNVIIHVSKIFQIVLTDSRPNKRTLFVLKIHFFFQFSQRVHVHVKQNLFPYYVMI